MEKETVRRIHRERQFLRRLFLKLPGSLTKLVRQASPSQVLACLYLLRHVIKEGLLLSVKQRLALRNLNDQDWLKSQFAYAKKFRRLINSAAKNPDKGRETVLRAEQALKVSLKALFDDGRQGKGS